MQSGKGGSTLKFACSSEGNGLVHEYGRFIQNLCGPQFVVHETTDMFCKDSLTGATLTYLIHTVRALTEGSLTVFSLESLMYSMYACMPALAASSQGYGGHINVNNHRVGEKYPIL